MSFRPRIFSISILSKKFERKQATKMTQPALKIFKSKFLVHTNHLIWVRNPSLERIEKRASCSLKNMRFDVLRLHFLKKDKPRPLFFFIFVFSIQLMVNKWIKIRRWLDLNRGPLVSEATALLSHNHYPSYGYLQRRFFITVRPRGHRTSFILT